MKIKKYSSIEKVKSNKLFHKDNLYRVYVNVESDNAISSRKLFEGTYTECLKYKRKLKF